jgi:threonine dehydrogenase-like Zn-dependent dehydrogenase
MKALVFDRRLRFTADAPRPIPKQGEALIRILMAGICNTDLELTKGYMDFSGIPGHEFVGCVEEVMGSSSDWVTKRVVGEINCGCGACVFCRSDLARHCRDRTVAGIAGRDGCFAEFMTLPVENLFEVPDCVRDEEAVFCEPVAAAFEVLEQVHIRPGEQVLVLGDGKLGLLLGMALGTSAAQVTLAGRHAVKLAIAAAAGVKTVSSEAPAAGAFDIVVEATGTPQGRAEAVKYVRPRGTLVVKSTLADTEDWDWTPIVVNELTVVGSRCGRFGPALHALKHKIRVLPLITEVYPLDRALEAVEHARRPEAVKVLLDMR